MKRFLLLFAAVAMVLSGCQKIEDELDALGGRLDVLEQTTLPSIEQQIEGINTQLASLKKTDEAIKEQIANLEKSDKATATEISNLKAKDSALEKSISDLQNYVNSEIRKAKSEAAAAYATIEQYNTLASQLSALGTSTNALGEQLTAKINAEVKSLNDKIADLENRLKAVEDKVESLLTRIQSVSYMPEYSDGVASISRMADMSSMTLSFKISPKECAAELAKMWESAVSCEALYTKTRSAVLADMPLTAFTADAERGIVNLTVSGENLSAQFFAGEQDAMVAMVISDGNNTLTSDYIPMQAHEITDEIWYTSTDGAIVTPAYVDSFGANIVSNTYENGKGVIKLDGDATTIRRGTYYNLLTLKSIVLPNSITTIGESAFYNCEGLESIYIPNSVTSIGRQAIKHCSNTNSSPLKIPGSVKVLGEYCFEYTRFPEIILSEGVQEIGTHAFHYSSRITSLTIPQSVTKIGDGAFLNCNRLEKIYGKYATEDNLNVIVDDRLIWVSSFVKGDYVIPSNVKILGAFAIAYPNNVITITIPDSVEEFYSDDFFRNSSFLLTNKVSALYGKYTTADNKAVIKDNVLYAVATHGLYTYSVPEGVIEMAPRMLLECGLVELHLPSTLKVLGQEQFVNCDTIRNIYCKAATPPTIGDKTFTTATKLEKVYVPTASVQAYKQAKYWKDIADKIVGYNF